METKHTQGPWYLAKSGNKESGQFIVIESKERGEAICQLNRQEHAHLIAAAPELLKALEWCEAVYGHDWPKNAAIRDTIRKARGE